jgi:pimeloyl-ACP methyl ester carboxylesterase
VAAVLEPGRAVPPASECRAKKLLDAEAAKQRLAAREEHYKEDLRSRLEMPLEGAVGPVTRVLFLPGKGSNSPWTDNWYADAALRVKAAGAARGRDLRPILPWEGGPEVMEGVSRELCWVAYAWRLMGEKTEDVWVVGHSMGANVALRMMQGTQVAGAVLVAGGYSKEDRDGDKEFRDHVGAERAQNMSEDELIVPWEFGAIAGHVPWISVLHSADDTVIPPPEARVIHEGLAKAGANVRLLEVQTAGHFLDKSAPDVVQELIARLDEPF